MSRFEKNSVCEGLAGVGVASVFSYTTMDTKESQATRSRLTQALFLGPHLVRVASLDGAHR